MSTADDDRIALDLLDAHLEDLWRAAVELQRGNRAVVPEAPRELGGAAADGAATELLRWGYGELAGIPRSPADVFARSVGSTLMEVRRRRSPWNAAALRLLEDPYVFLATGPRRHKDWAEDVLALMHREVPDPRGWLRIDGDRADHARYAVPAYPFEPPPAAEFQDRLHELEPAGAVTALAVMAEEWNEGRPVRNRPERDALLADARFLLDRYGPDARFWTNAQDAAADPARDFVQAGLEGTRVYGFITGEYTNGLDLFDELGLIAVSDEEVGVFWSFGAY
ncbi:hypothetical protein SLAV_05535 [Streptomyces lavendulae subsp. lavendulae]|uniref:Uncharacterized protein n=1 Tax=Streptomyces lavendulae subsp. lavendulae TaxID=58340 RepID=A0A2K8P8E0_STRLA|nr:hypothetical protein [Streptomyces lavendulae]ATZ23012.1 hypothetical protein SLAV_05535 [Streptomyces lavendulae subsp. lavendulae]QUQ52853.1 hypothetical protein SLLC_03570 [Streptomyces lavendulae subsp. lavendulae]